MKRESSVGRGQSMESLIPEQSRAVNGVSVTAGVSIAGKVRQGVVTMPISQLRKQDNTITQRKD